MKNATAILAGLMITVLASSAAVAGSINTSAAPRLVNEGKTFLDVNMPERAISVTNKALEMKELDPLGMALAFNNLCVAHFRIAQYQTALENCEKALKIDKKDHRFYVNRGNAYWGLGRFDLAIENYEKALELKPDNADAQYNLGLAQEKLREAQQTAPVRKTARNY